MASIEEYYDSYDEWGRLVRHRIEFEMTKRIFDRFIPAGSEVLDIGGGPGRYSIYLAKKGHKATLVDLSQKHIDQTLQKTSEEGVSVECIKGNALDLDKIMKGRENGFDAVLCMGPMYHLLEERQRVDVINKCLKLLKSNGSLIVSFILAYAALLDCLKNYPQEVNNLKESFLAYLKDGRYYSSNDQGFTDAYFIHPLSIKNFFIQFGLEPLYLGAVEGPGCLVEDKIMQLDEQAFQSWLDVFGRVSEDPVILGSCEHLLYTGRKIRYEY